MAFGLLMLAPMASANGGLPSGEHILGEAAVEPAYDDQNGHLIYLLTPMHAPLPVKAAPASWGPLYLIVYPAGSTVGTLNCMGVPGNCPDHDGLVAYFATLIMPTVYGTNPGAVLGHDHLVAPPASGGDFNIAWNVSLVLFTNTSFVNDHITTEAELDAALTNKEVVQVPTPIVFDCAVVSQATYDQGTPVSG